MASSATADFNFDTSALSTIKSIPNIGGLPGLCASGDTLYLDLDETLISAEPDAAEPAAKALAMALHQHGTDLTASWEAACFVWEAFQGPCAVRPTDGTATLAALTELQQRGLHIVGLTARAPSVSRETELQLERCGMLRVFSPLTLGHISEAEGPTLPPLTHRHGIIYCTGSRKVRLKIQFSLCAVRPGHPHMLREPAPSMVAVTPTNAHQSSVAVGLHSRIHVGVYYDSKGGCPPSLAQAEGLVAYESYRRGGGGGRRGGGGEREVGGGEGDLGHHGDDAMPAGRVVRLYIYIYR